MGFVLVDCEFDSCFLATLRNPSGCTCPSHKEGHCACVGLVWECSGPKLPA